MRQRTMKVFLQDKGHHQTATGMQMTHRPVNQRRQMPAAAAHKHRIGFPGYGHWRFAGENIDIAAGKALTILIKQP